jgi:ABC-type transport system involved in cytochrome c biogenesis permease subunit
MKNFIIWLKNDLVEIIGLMAMVVFLIGLSTTLGYLAHREQLSAWLNTETPMALSTAIGFVLTGTMGCLIALRMKQSNSKNHDH